MLNIYTIQLFSITKKCLFFNYYKLKFIFSVIQALLQSYIDMDILFKIEVNR